MSMPDMAAYLLERIAEDEQAAWGAVSDRPGSWVQGDNDAPGWDRDLVYYHSDWSGWTQFDYESMAAHVARHDPARVIAECEAKRRVVEHCQEVLLHHVHGDWDATDLAREALQHLVRVYAGRLDYPPEWPPEVAL